VSALRFVLMLASLCLPASMVVAAEMSGEWQGTLEENGETSAFSMLFSADGYPIFSYTNNQG
jgi:hypothetical protein